MEKTCKCCGAPLKQNGYWGWICEYCGTKYDTDTNGVYIRVSSPNCHTLMCKAEVDDYWVRTNPQMASKIVMDQLSSSLAETLKEYMTIQENIDPFSTTRIYRGLIRVIPEDYRY